MKNDRHHTPRTPIYKVDSSNSPLSDGNLILLTLEKNDFFDLEINVGQECIAVIIEGNVTLRVGASECALERHSVLDSECCAFFAIGQKCVRLIAPRDRSLVAVFLSARARRDDFAHFELAKSDASTTQKRGRSNYSRFVRSVRFVKDPLYLQVGETVAEDGNWSSYPPHKHDTYIQGAESQHEEAYIHMFSTPDGWGLQRIYSPSNGSDDAFVLQHGDVTVFAEGYHPVVAAPGYRHFYLWCLFGDGQLRMNDDPRYGHLSVKTSPARRDFASVISGYSSTAATGGHSVSWDKAQDCIIYGHSGESYIDLSSGVLIANVGHSHPRVVQAICEEARRGLLTSYLFPNESKAKLLEKLACHVPKCLDGILLFSTGSEAVEAALRIALHNARSRGGASRSRILSFENAFHGRTMGAQLMGGIPALKAWIPNGVGSSNFSQIRYPNGKHPQQQNFQATLHELEEKGIEASSVAAVIIEPYQGGEVVMAPAAYMQQLREWTKKHGILLILDEVQSGFGRTGRFWAYEHSGIIPDLVCAGKGISSSLPLSAVFCSRALQDAFGSCELSSTHSGNNVACAAACASLDVLIEERMIQNAEAIGEVISSQLKGIVAKNSEYFKYTSGIGAAHALVVHENVGIKFAQSIVDNALLSGVMLFNPVGPQGRTVKICPPLSMSRQVALEAMSSLKVAVQRAINAFSGGNLYEP